MPLFLVKFPAPVIYNQGHITGEKIVTETVVNAPNATGALMHAVRTVVGDVGEPTVEPYEKIPRVIPVETHPPHEAPVYVGG